MILFHEIYNRYTGIVCELLHVAQREGLTRSAVSRAIRDKGFFLDNTEFEAAFLNETGRSGRRTGDLDSLELLAEEKGHYFTMLPELPRSIPETLSERRWLKALLSDSRLRLFLQDNTRTALEERLGGVSELYGAEQILFKNNRTSGDPYTDSDYIRRFQVILGAIQQRRWLRVANGLPDGRLRRTLLMPLRLEYSVKDDVFRLCGAVPDASPYLPVSMRLSRIREVEETGEDGPEISYLDLLQGLKAPEFARLVIDPSRNGYERFLHFFSNYTRRAKYDESTRRLDVELDYYTFDENELIVSILAMGPIVKAIGPEGLKGKLLERYRKQAELLAAQRDGPH